MYSAKILIVENEIIIAEALKAQINSFGYSHVATVASGEAAVVISKENRPDLVIMDFKLDGEMDGIETMQIIRSQRDVPVIFLTAYTADVLQERAKQIRSFAYLQKPCDDQELKTKIRTALDEAEKGSKFGDSQTE